MSMARKVAFSILFLFSLLGVSFASVRDLRAATDLPPREARLAARRAPEAPDTPRRARRLPREIVYLHGRGENPTAEGCPVLRALLMAVGYTRCPAGNTRLWGGFDWVGRGEEMASRLDEESPLEPKLDALAKPSILFGFSQGGYVAPAILAARPGRFFAAILVGADVPLSKTSLERAGVRRIALAAGQWDMTAEGMKRTAKRLAREGVDARFVDLGAVGHTYFPKERHDIADVVAWLAEAETSGTDLGW